jgi:hypothetical protein
MRVQEEGMRLIGCAEPRDCSVSPVTEERPPVTGPAA